MYLLQASTMLSCMVIVCLTLGETARLFCRVTMPFNILISSEWGHSISVFSLGNGISSVFIF
jgi:hypothetical protein